MTDLEKYFDWMHDQYNDGGTVSPDRLMIEFPELDRPNAYGIYRAWQSEI